MINSRCFLRWLINSKHFDLNLAFDVLNNRSFYGNSCLYDEFLKLGLRRYTYFTAPLRPVK